MKWILFLLVTLSPVAYSADIDQELQTYVKEFKLIPLTPPTNFRPKIFKLGQRLFTSRILSGNKNIGCVDCHHPGVLTHDKLPLGVGEGSTGAEMGNRHRNQANGKILARNTPALFNLHGINSMFWDGRVSMDPETGFFTTPVAELNGPTPIRSDITKVLKTALAAQAIFPIADFAEMRGAPGSNPIADAKDTLEAWDLVVEQILADPDIKSLMAEAYPAEKINIGHVGEALAEFQTFAFDRSNTAYDSYLKGDLTALSPLEKKGMSVFFDKGKCGTCHQGEHLSMFEFESIGVPQIGPGKTNGDDLGRHEFDKTVDPYTFRVPPLRNVGLTAPYMHNGAFANLLQVVEHYDDIEASLSSYNFGNEWKNYVEKIADHNPANDKLRLESLAFDLSRKLHFTEEEEEALLAFLKTGLTDKELLDLIP